MKYEYLPQNREGYYYQHFFRLREEYCPGGFRSAFDATPYEVRDWLDEHVGKFRHEWTSIDGDISIHGTGAAFLFRLRWC